MERINLVELLKDCPEGMELDCTIWDSEAKVFLKRVLNDDFAYPIEVTVKYNNTECTKSFTKYGAFNDLSYCKCVIFPKGKTTWEGFQRPFKDGDIVFYSDTIAIFKEWGDETLFRAHAYTYLGYEEYLCKEKPVFGKGIRKEVRFATEEEKQKLFKAIKENGYKWNAETKTLEKLVEPKFKVGDKIRHKCPEFRGERIIKNCNDTGYFTTINDWIGYKNQDDWELVSNKFDITTLVPFESKVLVRNNKDQHWIPAFWGGKCTDGYTTTFGWSMFCIPFDGNEHLLNSNKDCDEFYRTWEKTGD